MGKIKAGAHTVETSNEDKVFFPDDDITKGDLIHYYQDMAETILPYMKGRPISIQRFPDGIGKQGFYQKEAPDYFPDWINRVKVKLKDGGKQQQVSCENAATLIYLADQGCITPHVWLSRQDKLDYPDRLIFDLDPPGDDFEPVREAAKSLKDLLEELKLDPLVMTTGSRGLHLVVPLDREADFETVRKFATDTAELLARRNPDAFTVEPRKEKRRGRIFLDYLRNAYGQTAVPPYAVRPRPGAPVATPVEWDELNDKKLTPRHYTINNIQKRLAQKTDPWKGMGQRAKSLKKARKLLDDLISDESS
jgi:bifunctional non-homologous end joining protein LigD